MTPPEQRSTLTLVPNERSPGYQLLARLGKTVLRPGGIELTNRLLRDLAISSDDDVVELAPGMGSTTERVLWANPASYMGVDRDPVVARDLPKIFTGANRSFSRASVSRTGLPDSSCDVAFGEAYLSMHPDSQKKNIIAELARVVRPGGRIGLHEVALQLGRLDGREAASEVECARITTELTARFKVSFNPIPLDEWVTMLTNAGFEMHEVHFAPLRLLEPDRIIQDEGFIGATRFVLNTMRDQSTRQRITHMRNTMQRNAKYLRAFALTATRVGPAGVA